MYDTDSISKQWSKDELLNKTVLGQLGSYMQKDQVINQHNTHQNKSNKSKIYYGGGEDRTNLKKYKKMQTNSFVTSE